MYMLQISLLFIIHLFFSLGKCEQYVSLLAARMWQRQREVSLSKIFKFGIPRKQIFHIFSYNI